MMKCPAFIMTVRKKLGQTIAKPRRFLGAG
jgi:hypothetical protein